MNPAIYQRYRHLLEPNNRYNADPKRSAANCGCDPGANHLCEWHATIAPAVRAFYGPPEDFFDTPMDRTEPEELPEASRDGILNPNYERDVATLSDRIAQALDAMFENRFIITPQSQMKEIMASRENSLDQTQDRVEQVRQHIGTSGFIDSSKLGQANQHFATGATRSGDAHKIDYEGHLSPRVLYLFGEYMHKHRVQRDGQIRASDNFQAGIPLHKYQKSLIRHAMDYWRAWRGEVTISPDNGKQQTLGDIACAELFNVMGKILELDRAGMLSLTSVPTGLREAIQEGRFAGDASAAHTYQAEPLSGGCMADFPICPQDLLPCEDCSPAEVRECQAFAEKRGEQ